MNKINMKEIERKMLTSYFDDGIWDMVIGFIFLAFGLSLQLDVAWMIGVLAAMAGLVPFQAKKVITVPRYGLIKPLDQQKRKYSMLAIAGIVIGLLLFIVVSLGSSTSIADYVRNNSLLMLGIIMGVLLILTAYFINFQRLYLYAGLFALSFSTGDLILTLPVKMIISGSIIILIGILVLIRFLQRYPRTEIPEI
jgi:membrane-associated HD superfamily phosphohydrolase